MKFSIIFNKLANIMISIWKRFISVQPPKLEHIEHPNHRPPSVTLKGKSFVYIPPEPIYTSPTRVLRARKQAREQIVIQDIKLCDILSMHRNILEITKLDIIISKREAEHENKT